MAQTQSDGGKITVSGREETCNYCSCTILEGTAFIMIANHVPFHIACWEKKKKDVRKQFGIIN